MKRNILLTGATGFLGSHLLEGILEQDYSTSIVKRSFSDTWRIAHLMDKLKSYDLDQDAIDKPFQEQQIDIVIHTACNYGRNNESVSQIVETNLMMGLRILDAAKKYGAKTFINTDTFFNKPEYPVDYMGEYILSKRHLWEWLLQSKKDIKPINMKLEHIYGPKDNPQKFFPWLILQFFNKTPDIKLSSCTQIRDFIHVKDVVSAYLKVLMKSDEIAGCTEYSVGTGTEASVKQMIETAKQLFEKQYGPITTILKYGSLPDRGKEIMRSTADIKALKEIGWSPKISLEDGIMDVLDNPFIQKWSGEN